jgi:hypothetical protein
MFIAAFFVHTRDGLLQPCGPRSNGKRGKTVMKTRFSSQNSFALSEKMRTFAAHFSSSKKWK